MLIGGLQKFSLLDYPGHIAAIVFTQGCNFHCHYCYNPMLVRATAEDKQSDIENTSVKKGHFSYSEDDLFAFLRSRQGKLDAVVITGGEPTLHRDLPRFIDEIKKIGLKVKLDTNGTEPDMIRQLLKKGAVDYLAMDIKSSPEHYEMVTGCQPDLQKIKASIEALISSDRPYEFRTTLVPGLADEDDIKAMGEMIKGAEKWFLQNFRSDTDLLDERFKKVSAFSSQAMENFRANGAKFVKSCLIR